MADLNIPKNEESHKSLIGRRLKRLRQQQSRTQEDVATASGFTKSMLSKIESGAVYPSVAGLVRIATALGTTVSAVMQENAGDRPVMVTRAQAQNALTQSDKGYSVYPYATELADKKMQPFLFVVKKGEVKPHGVSHAGEEFICVLEGEILFQVGETDYHLRPGDTLYFHSSQTHGVTPLSDIAKYIDIFI